MVVLPASEKTNRLFQVTINFSVIYMQFISADPADTANMLTYAYTYLQIYLRNASQILHYWVDEGKIRIDTFVDKNCGIRDK